MSFPGLLILFLGIIFIFSLILIVSQFFSREKELLNEAEEQIAEGERKQASSLLSRVLELNPSNPQARWLLGKVMEVAGNYSGAAKHYQYCLENEILPSNISREEALQRLEKIYSHAGPLSKAIRVTNELMDINPDEPDYLLKRGKLNYKAERYGEAVQDFQKLQDDFDNPPEKTTLFLARSYYSLGSLTQALSAYRNYIKTEPGDLDAVLEAASVAEESEDYSEAQSLYERVRAKGNNSYFTRATLALVRLNIIEGTYQRGQEYLDDLTELRESGELPSQYDLNYLYLKAKFMESQGGHEEALNLFRKIYDRKPDYKDVEEILSNEIEKMDEEDLIERFMRMDRDEFALTAEKITESMGYKVVSSDTFGPEEVNITAQDDSQVFKVDRILLTFKRWDQIIAEWPLKEFELELLEKRFDKGIFVSPKGFKPSAINFSEQGMVQTVGPDKLLTHLREAFKYKTL